MDEANSYAMALQRSVCEKFAGNGCMNQLPDYDRLCGRGDVITTAGGSSVVSALSTILITATAIMITLF